MCYDIKASLEAQLNRAKRNNDLQAIEEIKEKLVPMTDLPLYHASGFDHPQLLIYTDRSPDYPEVSTWGLIPFWARDREDARKQWNNTLNARGETIFEKASFKSSALHNRCIIYIDGFYEHHHFKGHTYPFYISKKNMEPIALAGLWSEWKDPDSRGKWNTFSIVTTEGNKMMEHIHNNPKLNGPRMPLILHRDLEDKWLEPLSDERDIHLLQDLIRTYPEDELQAHTVRRLRGKDYPGNVENITDEFIYDELSA